MKTEPLVLNQRMEDDVPVVFYGETRAEDLQELVQQVPELLQPEHLLEYSEALLFLNRPYRYQLITDPDAYRARYEERYLAESAEENYTDGVVRLSDFGLFDTQEISLPAADDERVVFYVEEAASGAPWRIVGPSPQAASRGGTAIDLQPLPLQPLPPVDFE